MSNHIMLDLECMGNGNNAAIVSIGACAFNSSDIVGKFYQKVKLESSVKAGMHIDASTILWWLEQEEAARKEIYDKVDQENLDTALHNFSSWYFAVGGKEVWGNGATYDNVVLRNAYKFCNIKCPWHYRDDRCFRTIKAMYPVQNLKLNGVAHNALDDAIWQAEYLKLLKVL